MAARNKIEGNQILRKLQFCSCAFCLSIHFSSQTFAANFTVNQAGDAGDLTCDATYTLRDAVDDANNAASDDTINFAILTTDAGCAIGVCTIILGQGLVITSAATADTLLIENTTGAGNLRVSGNNNSRGFFLLSGARQTLLFRTGRAGLFDYGRYRRYKFRCQR